MQAFQHFEVNAGSFDRDPAEPPLSEPISMPKRFEPRDENAPPEHPLAWVVPSALAVTAMASVKDSSMAQAAILKGRIPDFFYHDGPLNSITCVLSGVSNVEYKQSNTVRKFVARPGGFSISPGGSDLGYRLPQNVESLTLGIDKTELREISDQEFRPFSGSVELVPVFQKSNAEIVRLAVSISTLLKSPRPGSRLYVDSLWTQISLQLLWGFSNLPGQSMPIHHALDNPRVRKVIDYIEANLSEDLSLIDLAAITGLSSNHFLNSFRKSTGKSPHRYLTERRIARACELLRNPAMNIISVGLAVGFSSHSHFSSTFLRIMGTTPSKYRRQVFGIDSPHDP